MRKRQIAIVYTHHLFASAIACLLETEPRLQVACVDATQPDIGKELHRLQPQVVVVERDCQGPWKDPISMQIPDGNPWELVIVLGLRQPEMELFYDHRVSVATPDTLLAAVLENRGGRHR